MKQFQRLGILPTLLLGLALFIIGLLAMQHIVNNWWPFDVVRLDLVRSTAQGEVEAASILEAANKEIILAFLGAVLIAVTGLMLPIAYFINKRFSRYLDHRSGRSMPPQFHVTLRQAMWAGIWVSFCTWLQMNRALGLAVAALVAAVLVLLEIMLQIRARASTITLTKET
ncbi:MAG: hypothetical protein KBE23_04900 [Chloroflexi bacterium]|nr:hypothetical protein [Chloroflexota bacterium]MBP7042057.1 hypothetical protein [Chloroflexota bacterium]